ncbi:hypothetical protein CEXT_709021 [Caerostris extrusa]|uniref:Uncharacterized protein n=1 Tax=Caerostris extrusa TaxID=172846 RepID=A0AAV4NLZ1_CAEEX|nr:hypothetical protein CEXT_709021 [Caerostris extrusa]
MSETPLRMQGDTFLPQEDPARVTTNQPNPPRHTSVNDESCPETLDEAPLRGTFHPPRRSRSDDYKRTQSAPALPNTR